jgi:hypothetical protein
MHYIMENLGTIGTIIGKRGRERQKISWVCGQTTGSEGSQRHLQRRA